MKTPTINNYLETLSNPSKRFKTLAGIEILQTSDNQPAYFVRSKTFDAGIAYQGKTWVIACPLRPQNTLELKEYVQHRYQNVHPGDTTHAPLWLPGEMLVFNDHGQSGWQDIWMMEVSPEFWVRKRKLPESGENSLETHDSPPVFYEGLAALEKEGKYGYIDREGVPVIPFRYDWADAFDEGLAVVQRDGLFGLIDKQGEEIFPPVYEDLRWRSENGVVLACEEGAWRVKTRQGEAITNDTFDFIFDFSQGLASVRRNGKYGYIDRKGTVIIPLIYDEAYSFSDDGLATVIKNGITFSLDTEGMVFE